MLGIYVGLCKRDEELNSKEETLKANDEIH